MAISTIAVTVEFAAFFYIKRYINTVFWFAKYDKKILGHFQQWAKNFIVVNRHDSNQSRLVLELFISQYRYIELYREKEDLRGYYEHMKNFFVQSCLELFRNNQDLVKMSLRMYHYLVVKYPEFEKLIVERYYAMVLYPLIKIFEDCDKKEFGDLREFIVELGALKNHKPENPFTKTTPVRLKIRYRIYV